MTARPEIEAVTSRIRECSRAGREAYLDRVEQAANAGVHRSTLSCGNLAHGFAACAASDKAAAASAFFPAIWARRSSRFRRSRPIIG